MYIKKPDFVQNRAWLVPPPCHSEFAAADEESLRVLSCFTVKQAMANVSANQLEAISQSLVSTRSFEMTYNLYQARTSLLSISPSPSTSQAGQVLTGWPRCWRIRILSAASLSPSPSISPGTPAGSG